MQRQIIKVTKKSDYRSGGGQRSLTLELLEDRGFERLAGGSGPVRIAELEQAGRDAGENRCPRSGEDAGRLGSVLQSAADLDALSLYAVPACALGVRPDFEALPSDVRQHRHCDRQRSHPEVSPARPVLRAAGAAVLHRAADAGLDARAMTRNRVSVRVRGNPLF